MLRIGWGLAVLYHVRHCSTTVSSPEECINGVGCGEGRLVGVSLGL